MNDTNVPHRFSLLGIGGLMVAENLEAAVGAGDAGEVAEMVDLVVHVAEEGWSDEDWRRVRVQA